MKIYKVGGCVRDQLLGVNQKDIDYVVVGSRPEEMSAKGFTKVGADFPVFLHPVTKDEYALARTERKVGSGYNGFECKWEGVSLEEDLSRRDLTINSIAQDIDTGEIIDPFNGRVDLHNKQLKPTSEAFKEDPVRLLRAARFLSRYEDFTPSTELIRYGFDMGVSGELNTLIPERVWKECEKVLGEKQPCKFFEFLLEFNLPFMEIFHRMKSCTENNAWHRESNVFVHTMMVLQYANVKWNDPEINFAALLHDIAKPYCYSERGNGHGHDEEGVQMIEDWCSVWKVPKTYRDLAKITCEQHQKVHTVLGRDLNKWSRPKSIMKIFEQTSALSKPERFKKMLKVCESDNFGRISDTPKDSYPQKQYLEECLEAVLNLDTKDISAKMLEEGKNGLAIGEQIRVARINEIRKVKIKWENILC